jgi:hypothetical protein
MLRLITLISGSFVLVNSFGQLQPTVQELYPLDKVITYCLKDSQNIFSTVKFEYDSRYRKIRMDKTTGNRLDYYILYKYNEFGDLESEDLYINWDSLYLESTYKYIYNDSHKLISKVEYYSSDGKSLIKKSESKYDTITTKEGKYIKKEIDNEVISLDRKGRLVEKRNCNNSAKVIKYKYRGLFLVSESFYSDKNWLIKKYLYTYDNGELRKRYTEMYDLPISNRKNKKLGNYELEEYKYKSGKIIEKRTIDRGFDPCGAYCCGNYIIKYVYKEK